MRITTIEYERLKSLGQFENHRGKVIIECGPEEDPNQAMEFAKSFLEQHLNATPQQQPPPWESYPWSGSVCPACGEHQRQTPSGPVCRNGHGCV